MANLGLSAIEAFRMHPERIAFISSELSLTYKEFEGIVYAFAVNMHQNKIGRGSLVGILTKDPRVALAGALASQMLGAAWIEATNEALSTQDFKITHVLCQSDDAFRVKHKNIVIIDSGWAPNVNSQRYFDDIPNKGFSSKKKIARVLQSSGTTGKRKFILVDAESEFKRLHRFSKFMEPEQAVLGSLFPPLSVAGFNSRLRVVMSGGTCVEVNPGHYSEKGVNVVYGSPYQLRKYLDVYGKSQIEKIDMVATAGARPSSSLVNDLLLVFNKVRIGYGSSEFGTVAVGDISQSSDDMKTLTLVNDRFMSVEIVNEKKQRLPYGVEGILRMRNDIDLPIYLPKILNKGRDGWFYPGDLGILTKDRKIVITGRTSDIFNIKGIKIRTLDLDDAVQSVDGVADGYCFVVDDNVNDEALYFIVQLENGIDSTKIVGNINEIIVKEFGPAMKPKGVLITMKVPRTATGKPVRSAVAKQFISQRVSVPPPVS